MGLEGNYYQYFLDLYPQKAQFLNWIKLSMDNQVYNYGNHLKMPMENINIRYYLKKRISYIKHHIIDSYSIKKRGGYRDSIVSNAYSTLNATLSDFSDEKVMPMPWSYGVDVFSSRRLRHIVGNISYYSINQLLDDKSYDDVMFLYDRMKLFLKEYHIKMVICYNDMYPLERMIIDAGKEMGVPTAVFLHGLPGRYDCIDDNRADYLFVWGEGIKELCVKAGMSPEKIIITGHPFFSSFQSPVMKDDRNPSPLIITYVGGGVPSNSSEYEMSDRGNSISYAWCVEEALKKIGVCRASLRLHPSENPLWYKKNVDMGFYELDGAKLSDSIKTHSYIIGPTSTVAIDAAIQGVPYFGFSPYFKYASPLVPPFNNSEQGFPIARTVDELKLNIESRRFMQPVVFSKYMASPFNSDAILSLIKKYE